MLDLAQAIVASALHRQESRGSHQRTDYPQTGRRAHFLAHSLACPERGQFAENRAPTGHDHALAAGRARLREIATHAAYDYVWRSLGTARNRTRNPRSRPTRCHFASDWVVLDALNYVKDRMDGSLSYRWSCRMGVCGSCGMMVNGQPKLTCAAFLSDHLPGPDPAWSRLNYLPDRARSGRGHYGLPEEADEGQTLDHPRPGLAASRRESTDKPPSNWTPTSSSAMCINCMLCYAACPIVRIGAWLRRAGGDRAGSAV